MASLNIQVYDSTVEEGPASMTVPVVDGISVVNAQTLIASINALSIGNFGQQVIKTEELVAAGTAEHPATPLAQKEIRYRVKFQDTETLKFYSYTVPCADLTLLPAGSEYIDLTAGVGLALKTDFELYGRSELGNTVVLIEIHFIGL